MKKFSMLICLIIALCMLCSCSKLALDSDKPTVGETDTGTPPPVDTNSTENTDTSENTDTESDTETDVNDTETGNDAEEPENAPDAVFYRYTSYDSVFSAISGNGDIVFGLYPEEMSMDMTYSLTTVNGTAGQVAHLNPTATDGEYIYTVYRGTLVICSGEEILSETYLYTPEYYREEGIHYAFGSENVSGVFLSDSILAAVTTTYESTDTRATVYRTNIYFYDISDPAAPVFKNRLSQDGAFLSALTHDGKLFTVSSESADSIDENDVTTFIPHIYDHSKVVPDSLEDSGSSPIPPEKIAVFKYSTCPCYTITTACDIPTAAFTDAAAVYGGNGRFYADSSNIYLLFFAEISTLNSTRTEDSHDVYEYTDSTTTTVIKYPLDGTLTPCGETLVDGCFTNDFSIHSKDGSLYFCAVSEHTDYSLFINTENGDSERKYTTAEVCDVFYELSPDFTSVKSTVLSDAEISSVRFADKYMCIDYYSSMEYYDITAVQPVDGISFSEFMCNYDDGLILGITRIDEETLSFTMYNADDLSIYSFADLTAPTGYLDASSVQLHSEAGIITLHAGFGKHLIVGFDENGFELRSVTSVTGLAHSAVTENAVFIITDSVNQDKIVAFTADGKTETASFELTVFEGAVG